MSKLRRPKLRAALSRVLAQHVEMDDALAISELLDELERVFAACLAADVAELERQRLLEWQERVAGLALGEGAIPGDGDASPGDGDASPGDGDASPGDGDSPRSGGTEGVSSPKAT